MSEEEQARLLDEYEKEIKERESKTETAKEVIEPNKGKGGNKKQQQQQQQQSKASNKSAQKQNTTKTTKGGAKHTSAKEHASKHAKKVDPKEESTSDESWEKDFDELDQQ